MPITLDDLHYTAVLEMLERDEQHRSGLDFTLPDLPGHPWRRQGLKGKIVIVTFWATWCPPCPPCRLEVSHLIELKRRFADNGLEIVAISDEDGGTRRAPCFS